MSSISMSTEEIIEKLGYNNSSNLFYYNDLYTINNLSFHIIKVLKELKPCAFYCIDNKPFVLFFDKVDDFERMKALSKKIWNFQIPVVIFNGESDIKIYNGNSLDTNSVTLDIIEQKNINHCEEFSSFSYWNVTSQNFWGDFQKKYSSKKLNEIMLDNIESVTNDLKKKYNIKFATKLVLRLIFIRFLIDREVDLGYEDFSNDVINSQRTLLKISQDKSRLYDLFDYLKNKFNGNLFDLGDELADENLTSDVFILLYEFLSGKLILSSGQLSLFPMYDFNIIPVELISNIYEVLLGKEIQSKDKAFYTPYFLVDYILNQSVKSYLRENKECRVLDPSCGSGIFLVECFKRIAEQNRDGNGYFNNDERLVEIVKNNIFGIDRNEDAIDVTIFSLYLTILDYKDPKTLVKFKLPNLKNENLIVSDFFDDKKTEKLKAYDFDFIIGNPPWGSIKNGLHVNYCNDNNIPNSDKEISISFISKVKEFCTNKTTCCLVIPSKLLYNGKTKAVEFRQILLNSYKFEKIIELSSVRKLVFKNAKAPATVIIFKKNNCEYMNNKITYISLKPNIFFKLFNIIVIEKNDIKYVQQKLLLENDWAWKTIVYGTSWDFEIINNIRKKYKTINEIIKNNFIVGAGIEYQVGDRNDAQHFLGKPILDSNYGIDHFGINTSKVDIFNKPKIHRTRNSKLFKPPYCLITTGVNCENYKMRAAYSENEFLYKKAIYSIKGTMDQKDVLLNLTGLFNSSFYSYLNLMLGSSIGIEREQRFIEEIFNFPYIYSDEIQKKVTLIQALKNSNELGAFDEAENQINNLDNLILELFGLIDDPFVDYALNVQTPLITNSNKLISYRAVQNDDLIKYSELFKNYFSKIYNKANKFIKVILYPKVKGKFSIFELVICDDKPLEDVWILDNIDENKDLMTKFMINRTNDLFYQIKDVVNFEENSFFIIKTNEYKNWHPAIAQIDLSEIIEEMLSVNGGEQ